MVPSLSGGMKNNNDMSLLIDAADSLLIVIDVQDAFLDKLPLDESDRLLNNVCWLVDVAKWLDVPLLVTAEEMEIEMPTERLMGRLPEKTTIFDKWVFGLAGQPDIQSVVAKAGRQTIVLIGLETDVCVMHSALGLLEQGYRVVVVRDAVGTPAPNGEIGLARMQAAGVVMTNLKGLFYEWMRTVEMVGRFHRELPHMRAQAGVVL